MMKQQLLALLGIASITAMAANAQRTNFAKYQHATASVQNSTYVADFAVDGIASNFHSWRTGDNPGTHWLEISYPRPVTLASAHLYSGLINANAIQVYQNFKFQYHDGTGWIDIPGSTVTGNTNPEANVIFDAPITSTRFRLHSTDSTNRTVRQLAFFPPNPDGEGVEQGYPVGTDVTLNLAYKRPATASSADVNHPFGPGYAKNAFDGYLDDTSRWLCTSAEGEWLEVDLLTNQGVGSAHVYTGSIGTSDPRETTEPMPDFKLQSWSGSEWIDIPGADITGNTQVARNIEFSETVLTSRVRLVTTSAFNGRVQQLLLFPPRSGGYELGREVIDAPPPTATWNDFADSTYRLRVQPSPDRRLGLINGSAIFTNNAAGADAVNWQILHNSRDGSYRIRNVKTGHCLALAEISKAANTLVVAETYTGMPHQNWFLDYTTPTKFRLINAYSGLALEPLNGNQNLGTPLAVGTPGDSVVQRWDTAFQHHHPKKGVAATNGIPDPPFADPTATWLSHLFPLFRHSSWSYSWGRQRSTAFPYMGKDHTFNPMQWGNFNFAHGNAQGPLENIRNDLQSNPRPVSLMGFNEPDGSSQANMTVATAIARWPRLEAMEMPLVSPGPINIPTPWIDDFYAEADALGYRVDYTNMHWYRQPNSQLLITQLHAAYERYGRPIWLTEFSVVRWSGTAQWTHGDNYNFLAEFMWRAESLPWLRRYSLFNFREDASGPNQSANDPPEAPRSNSIRSDGTLTPFGELYATWDGVTAVLDHTAYHLHNRAHFRRARNPSDGDNIASIAPDAGTGADQWFLIPGTAENTVRIVSTHDGRRVRYFSGADVGLAAADNTQPQTEWRLVPVTSGANHDGWYFINHPNTDRRLRMDGNGAILDGAGTNTGDNFKWRFVIPMAPEPTAAPTTTTSVGAQPTIGGISLTWADTDGALTYRIRRSTSETGPWTTVADDLTATTWSDEGLDPEATWFYQVIAINNLGESTPSDAISATTIHPFATYDGWAAEFLDGLPPEKQEPGADPDGDGLPNLLEYAFLTNPTVAGGNPFRIDTENYDINTITLVFPWNWRASGHSWRIRHSPDLGNISSWPVLDPGLVTIERDGDIDWIRATPAMVHPDRGFYILDVIED